MARERMVIERAMLPCWTRLELFKRAMIFWSLRKEIRVDMDTGAEGKEASKIYVNDHQKAYILYLKSVSTVIPWASTRYHAQPIYWFGLSYNELPPFCQGKGKFPLVPWYFLWDWRVSTPRTCLLYKESRCLPYIIAFLSPLVPPSIEIMCRIAISATANGFTGCHIRDLTMASSASSQSCIANSSRLHVVSSPEIDVACHVHDASCIRVMSRASIHSLKNGCMLLKICHRGVKVVSSSS